MKQKQLIHILGTGTFGFLLAAGIASCSDVNDWSTDPSFDRLFGTRQASLSVEPEALSATVEWEATPKTQSYLIEVSTDSLYDDRAMGEGGSLLYGTDGSITRSPYVLTGLKGETTYYLRIKSVSEGKESRWVYPEKFKFTTDAEQIFHKVADDDVTDESVRLTWDAAMEVTRIEYVRDEEEPAVRELTAEERAAGEVLIDGLDPKVTYTFMIYNGDTRRGTLEVQTKAAVMADSEVTVDAAARRVTFTWGENIGRLTGYVLLEGDVYPADQPQTALTDAQLQARQLTLTGLKGSTTYTVAVMRGRTVRALQTFKTWADIPADYTKVNVGNTDEWDAALASHSGKVAVVLTGDVDLTASGTAKIPASITSLLVWGGDVVTAEKAHTFRTKGLSFLGNMDAVEFYNLNLFANGSTNNYLFDFNGSKADVNTVSLTSCVLDEARGVFRLRSSSTGTLRNIVAEDCLIRNIGSYGFVAQEGSGLTLGTVTLKKCTYVPHSSGKCLLQNKGGNVVGVVIDQCTFYGFTYAFLDNNKAGFTLDISRTLMGGFTGSKFFQNIATATVNSCKDFYVSADSPFETSIGETKLELKDADLFANPGAGDFRVKPTEYAAFGDPRWEK